MISSSSSRSSSTSIASTSYSTSCSTSGRVVLVGEGRGTMGARERARMGRRDS